MAPIPHQIAQTNLVQRGGHPQPSGEQVVFDENGIRITTARAMFGATTFALANITSISGGETLADRSGPRSSRVFGGLCGLASVVLGAGCGSVSSSVGLGAATFLLFALGAATCWVIAAIWDSSLHDIYLVKICTSAGQQNVHQSSNQSEVRRIVQALNEALARRG